MDNYSKYVIPTVLIVMIVSFQNCADSSSVAEAESTYVSFDNGNNDVLKVMSGECDDEACYFDLVDAEAETVGVPKAARSLVVDFSVTPSQQSLVVEFVVSQQAKNSSLNGTSICDFVVRQDKEGYVAVCPHSVSEKDGFYIQKR